MKKINTESKRFKILAEKGFVEPKNFLIGSSYELEDLDSDTCHFKTVPKFGYYVLFRHSLKMFLEIRGMLPAILNYVQELAQATVFVKNCMQGRLWSSDSNIDWKDKIDFSEDSITLPLAVYFDEFVAGAALGANATATKFGAVYATILCLPPFIASKLSSILFSTIVLAKDLAEFENTKVFST